MAKNDARRRKERIRRKSRAGELPQARISKVITWNAASLTEYFQKFHQAADGDGFMAGAFLSLVEKHGHVVGYDHYLRLEAVIDFLNEPPDILLDAGVLTVTKGEDGRRNWGASEWLMESLATGGAYDRHGWYVFDADSVVRGAVRLHQEHGEPLMNATPASPVGDAGGGG
jgi:hypothetical protein